MTFKIHYTLPDGTEDYVVVEGESPELIKEQADVELVKRGGKDAWSEQVLS